MSGRRSKLSFSYQKLTQALEKEQHTKTWLGKRLDRDGVLTETNYWKCLKDGRMSFRTLEAIAEILGCDISDLREKPTF